MLHKIRLKPGLDKQSSDTGAEGKWVQRRLFSLSL